MNGYIVNIDEFDGPLDLLLHFVKESKLEIEDINVALITNQYVEYIESLKELNLNIASEYLVMAAQLIEMKSKILLPREIIDTDELVDYEEDPREQLINRLLEYKKYKDLQPLFRTREEDRKNYFMKPPADLTEFVTIDDTLSLPDNLDVYDLLSAFEKGLRKSIIKNPLTAKINRDEINIEERMEWIIDELTDKDRRMHFDELFAVHTKQDVVASFIAILELIKYKKVKVYQDLNFGDIYIEPGDKMHNKNHIGGIGNE